MTNTNIDFGTATPAELAAAGFTTKTLRKRGPRKGETLSRNGQLNTGGAVGAMGAGDRIGGVTSAVGGGKGQTITRVTGLGKEMVRDLDAVKRKAAAQYKADRRQAALDRAQGL